MIGVTQWFAAMLELDSNNETDIDFVENTLEELQSVWHTIATVQELWNAVNQPLTDIGCEDIVFLLNPTRVLRKTTAMPVQFFQTGVTSSLLQVEIANTEMDILVKNMDHEFHLQFSSFVQIQPSTLKQFSDLEPMNDYFGKNAQIYASRHFGSNLFSSYAAFRIRNNIVFNHGARANTMSVLLNLIHIKLFDIYSKKNLDIVSVSPREKQVLQRLVRGETNNQMAEILGISPHTVNAYVNVIGLKLKSGNRTTTALKAVALGLVKI